MADPAPTLGDGDDDDGDEEVIECVIPESLYNPTDPDEIRRAWLIGALVNPENVMLKGVREEVYDWDVWLKDGTTKRKSDSKFKVVKE